MLTSQSRCCVGACVRGAPLLTSACAVVSWRSREWHEHVFGPLEVASLGQRVPSVFVRPLIQAKQPPAKGSVRGAKRPPVVTWDTYSPHTGYYTVSIGPVR